MAPTIIHQQMETEIVQNAVCSLPSPDQSAPSSINAGY
uniref:Uncharacterized protein n=1 Tax=Solanum demissum TaxID=50514 RepID=Q0KIQ7_SOLDE|nr:hypothetical protein SDM1_32t00017 [Solanum demissum]